MSAVVLVDSGLSLFVRPASSPVSSGYVSPAVSTREWAMRVCMYAQGSTVLYSRVKVRGVRLLYERTNQDRMGFRRVAQFCHAADLVVG